MQAMVKNTLVSGVKCICYRRIKKVVHELGLSSKQVLFQSRNLEVILHPQDLLKPHHSNQHNNKQCKQAILQKSRRLPKMTQLVTKTRILQKQMDNHRKSKTQFLINDRDWNDF